MACVCGEIADRGTHRKACWRIETAETHRFQGKELPVHHHVERLLVFEMAFRGTIELSLPFVLKRQKTQMTGLLSLVLIRLSSSRNSRQRISIQQRASSLRPGPTTERKTERYSSMRYLEVGERVSLFGTGQGARETPVPAGPTSVRHDTQEGQGHDRSISLLVLLATPPPLQLTRELNYGVQILDHHYYICSLGS